jgi:ribosome recycling factor
MDLNDLERRMNGAVSVLKTELAGLRTGRASISLVEPIHVDVYGASMPLNQVATISVPEPRMPIVEGQLLRIPIPELNAERRQELVKVAHKYAEQAKVAVRHVRRDGLDNLKKEEKDGGMSEDESHGLADRVQKLTDATISEIDEMLAHKEAEITQV